LFRDSVEEDFYQGQTRFHLKRFSVQLLWVSDGTFGRLLSSSPLPGSKQWDQD